MYDIFLMEEVRKLVQNKSIVFIGDSNVRALYKDFLCLLQGSHFISAFKLKNKMENSVFGDKLVYHDKKTNGRCYREEREASINNACVSFYFLTKIYDDYVEDVLERITRKSNPDVIIINSCVWDITRWGCDGVYHYKKNLEFLMRKFRKLIPSCLVIWVTTPPLACEVRGGFLVTELQFLKYSLRFHVVEANHFARKVVVKNGFDVLDTHFHLQMQIHRREPDGIHWGPKAVRYITNLILRHICLSWDVPLPHRYESTVEDENLIISEDIKDCIIIKPEKKKKAVDLMKQAHSKESTVLESCEKLQSTVAVVINQAVTKRHKRDSIQLYRIPKKEENIHNHMARTEKKARIKRMRKWKQPSLGDFPQSYSDSYECNSQASSLTNDKKRLTHKAYLFNSSFQTQQQLAPSTPVCTIKQISTSFSQIPLPPYSPSYHQGHNSYAQSNEYQLPIFNRSNDFDFPLITSRSQMPLPPYSPGHHSPDSNYVQGNESPPSPFFFYLHHFTIVSSPSQTPLSSFSTCHNQFESIFPRKHVHYEPASKVYV